MVLQAAQTRKQGLAQGVITRPQLHACGLLGRTPCSCRAAASGASCTRWPGGRVPAGPSSLHPLISSQGTERGQKETVLQAAWHGRNALFPDKPARLMLAPISSPRHGTRDVAVQLCHLSVPSALGRWVRNRTHRDTKRHQV